VCHQQQQQKKQRLQILAPSPKASTFFLNLLSLGSMKGKKVLAYA